MLDTKEKKIYIEWLYLYIQIQEDDGLQFVSKEQYEEYIQLLKKKKVMTIQKQRNELSEQQLKVLDQILKKINQIEQVNKIDITKTVKQIVNKKIED